jgi:hypothetical protein
MLSMLLGQGLGMAGNVLSNHLQANQQKDLLSKQQEQAQAQLTNNAYNAPQQQTKGMFATAQINTPTQQELDEHNAWKQQVAAEQQPQQQGTSLQALAAQNSAPGTNYYNRAAGELGMSTHRGQASTPGNEVSPTDPNYRQGGNYLAHTPQGNTEAIRERAGQLFVENLTNQSQVAGQNLTSNLNEQMNQQTMAGVGQDLGQGIGNLAMNTGSQFMQNMIAQSGQQKPNPMGFLQNLIGG